MPQLTNEGTTHEPYTEETETLRDLLARIIDGDEEDADEGESHPDEEPTAEDENTADFIEKVIIPTALDFLLQVNMDDEHDDGGDGDDTSEDNDHSRILIDSIQLQMQYMYPPTRRWLIDFLSEVYRWIIEEAESITEGAESEETSDRLDHIAQMTDRIAQTTLRERLLAVEAGYEFAADYRSIILSRVVAHSPSEDPVIPGLDITSPADLSPALIQEHLSVDIVTAFLLLDTYAWLAYRHSTKGMEAHHSRIMALTRPVPEAKVEEEA